MIREFTLFIMYVIFLKNDNFGLKMKISKFSEFKKFFRFYFGINLKNTSKFLWIVWNSALVTANARHVDHVKVFSVKNSVQIKLINVLFSFRLFGHYCQTNHVSFIGNSLFAEKIIELC